MVIFVLRPMGEGEGEEGAQNVIGGLRVKGWGNNEYICA